MDDGSHDVDMEDRAGISEGQKEATPPPEPDEDDDPEDPLKSTPLTRYNAMLAIVKNTLYMSVPVR